MAAIAGPQAIALLVARVLTGGTLAFMGLNHFMQTEQMTGYAQHKGVPAPKTSVLGSGAVLTLGGLFIVLGIYAGIGSLLLAIFLLGSGVMMHNFWAVPEEQKQEEMTQFLKNVALAGGTFALFALSAFSWPYAVDVGMF